MNIVFRRLFTFLLSFSLLVGQNLALAEGDIPDLGPQISSDAEGFDSENQTYSLRKDVDLSNSEIIDQVTMFAAAGMGADMIPGIGDKCENYTPDMYTYLGGSVIYMTAQVFSQIKLAKANENHIQNQIQLTGDKPSDIQSLETMKKIEEERLKATKAKKTALDILMGAYVLSEVLALVWMFKDAATEAGEKCAGPGYAACYIGFLPVVPTSNSPSCKAEEAKISFKNKNLGEVGKEYGVPALNIALSCGSKQEATKPELTGLAMSAVLPAISGQPLSDILLSVILNLGGARCMAAVMNAGKKYYKKPAYKMFGRHMLRALYYGAAIGITGINSGITNKKKRAIEGNLNDLNRVISDYKSKHTSDGGIDEGTLSGTDWDAYFADYQAGAFPPGQEPYGSEYLKQISEMNLKQVRAGANLKSPTIANSIAALNSATKSIKEGNIGRAMASGENLARNLSKLKKIRDDLRVKVNDKLKKEGKKPIDFDARSNKLASQMRGEAQNAIKEAGGNAALNNVLSEQTKEIKKELKTVAGTQDAAEVTASNNVQTDIPEDIFAEDFQQENMLDMAANSPEQSLNDFVVNDKDINKNRSGSIFKLLSVRYLKTAYPKLLEEAK